MKTAGHWVSATRRRDAGLRREPPQPTALVASMLMATAISLLCATVVRANPATHAGGDAAVARRLAPATAPPYSNSVRELAAALQETTAGDEQMFCAADLARLPSSPAHLHVHAMPRLLARAEAGTTQSGKDTRRADAH